MDNLGVDKAKSRYEELFSSVESKAEAFDKLAEKYYYANFGSASKSDIDVLLFSVYLERILDSSEDNVSSYSDYTLSKLLGITQTRVSNLKVKKELQYPYSSFSWKKSFERIVDNYRYDNGKIKLHIPDKNLYLELKNVIENAGGYVEVQLNSTLLQINPECFTDVLIATLDENAQIKVKEQIKKTLDEHKVSTEFFEKKSIGEMLKACAPDIITGIVCELFEICIPFVGPIIRPGLARMKNELSKQA